MRKSKSKQRQRSRPPSFSPTTAIRLRLDRWWSSETFPQQDETSLYAGLDDVASGVESELLLLTMIRAYLAAPPHTQTRLDEVLPR